MQVSRALLFSCLMVLLGACVSRADEIVLKNGGSLQGEIVSRTDALVVLQTAYGSVTFDVADIQEVRYSSALEREIRSQLKNTAPADTTALLKLAARAQGAGLTALGRTIYTQIIAVEPDDRTARQALGYILYEGEWVTLRERNLHPNLVSYRGQWVTRDERDRLRKGDEHARYIESFDVSPSEGQAILSSISDIDVAIEPRGGQIVRRHVQSLPVKDKPYVYSIDILNWQRLGVFIGVTFIDGSRRRIPGLGELEYAIYATEADALGSRKIGALVTAGTVSVKPDMWRRKSDFRYWDSRVNTTYEDIASDEQRAAWAEVEYMNYDGVLYVLANRDITVLAPPGVYYVEATLTVQNRTKKVGRFVQYAELR